VELTILRVDTGQRINWRADLQMRRGELPSPPDEDDYEADACHAGRAREQHRRNRVPI
jgi:hypothetical protein